MGRSLPIPKRLLKAPYSVDSKDKIMYNYKPVDSL